MGAIIHFFQVPLYRELSVAALIILLIIVYYFRYLHFARLPDTRLHRRWLDKLIHGTRRVMIVFAVALVGLVVYDRLIMPRMSTSATASATSSKRAPADRTKKKAAPKASAKKQAASSSGEVIDATEHPLSSQQYHDLLVVENYYKKNATDENAAEAYRYRGQATGNAGVKVTEIGGYQKLGSKKLKLTHLYWVYPSGQFDVHQ
ncbi:hypothetical protein ACFQ3L_08485 [Lacticaseibacillus jixianensis]|uniref:Uncharacterized protein n=1 Tax=Lacticaseibacillus jixianensis TaxID=2486012 RepID=A0ABW4BB97_9LACO|nr:hypothetical protein [Lacticaseibacillus jixianensis]